MAESTTEQSEREETVDVRRIRPPDRKKFEEETEAINVLIREKEAELKSVSPRPDERISSELRTIRSQKEETIGRRKRIDNELREVNQHISKQMENLTKIQSSLAYKNEDRINEAIRRLEHQLKTVNFTLREEKSIVAEIDRMRRSKKTLVQFNALKHEIDGLRGRQRAMREERDRLHKAVTGLKTREEEVKRRTQANRAKADHFKIELDVLYERRRQVIGEFRRAEQEFNDVRKESRRQYRDEKNRKREEERRQQLEQYQKDLAEYEESREPYEDEKQLCATLIAYLQRHLATVEPTTGANDGTPPDGYSPRATDGPRVEVTSPEAVSSRDPKEEGMYVLRKKEEDQFLFSGIIRSKPNKRSKKEKKKACNKPIVHTPEIFAQFASLNLTAPSATAEVPGSINQLQDKKSYYQSLPRPTKPSIQVDTGTSGTEAPSDGSGPSYAESFISESIPTTPEVAFDNMPPRFPRGGDVSDEMTSQWPLPRELSHDSGLCELDVEDPVAPPSGGQKHHHQGAPGALYQQLPLQQQQQQQQQHVGSGDSLCKQGSLAVITTAVPTARTVGKELPEDSYHHHHHHHHHHQAVSEVGPCAPPPGLLPDLSPQAGDMALTTTTVTPDQSNRTERLAASPHS